jgi:drug/metabolite transporter (DMT)-like permease
VVADAVDITGMDAGTVQSPLARTAETLRPQCASTTSASTASADWLLLVVPGVIWGASFLFIAEGLRAVGPYGVTFARLLVGFTTLSFVPSARRAVPRSDWTAIAMLGLLWFALPLSMFPFAEQRVSSALTGMLNGATPLFVALVAAIIARRAPSSRTIAGLAVGLVGAVLVAWPTIDEDPGGLGGVLLILVALVSYGIALNLARPLQQRHGAVPIIWRGQAVAVALTAPLGVLDLLEARWMPGPLLAILMLGALGTGVAFIVIGVAAVRLGATRASAAAFLIPAVALVLGVVVRDERVALLSVIGGALCVAGAWLIHRAGSH